MAVIAAVVAVALVATIPSTMRLLWRSRMSLLRRRGLRTRLRRWAVLCTRRFYARLLRLWHRAILGARRLCTRLRLRLRHRTILGTRLGLPRRLMVVAQSVRIR